MLQAAAVYLSARATELQQRQLLLPKFPSGPEVVRQQVNGADVAMTSARGGYISHSFNELKQMQLTLVKAGQMVKAVLERMVKTQTPLPSVAGDIFAALVDFVSVYENSRAAADSSCVKSTARSRDLVSSKCLGVRLLKRLAHFD